MTDNKKKIIKKGGVSLDRDDLDRMDKLCNIIGINARSELVRHLVTKELFRCEQGKFEEV